MRVKAVYTPYLNDRENKHRLEIVESTKHLNSATALLVSASAIVLNGIKIHDKVFGTSKDVNIELINELSTIAESLMFELNEITHMDMDLSKNIIRAVLNRLYPIVSITTTSDLVLLLNNNSGISIEMIENMTDESYMSNKLFNAVSTLFNLVDRYNIEYTGDNEISCVNKL